MYFLLATESFWDTISKEGIQTAPDPVNYAIKVLSKPENVCDLKHLLGMEDQIRKFAKNLADTTKLLQEFLKKETEWV